MKSVIRNYTIRVDDWGWENAMNLLFSANKNVVIIHWVRVKHAARMNACVCMHLLQHLAWEKEKWVTCWRVIWKSLIRDTYNKNADKNKWFRGAKIYLKRLSHHNPTQTAQGSCGMTFCILSFNTARKIQQKGVEDAEYYSHKRKHVSVWNTV